MMNFKKKLKSRPLSLGLLAGCLAIIGVLAFVSKAQKPMRILLITSGCCHNYDFQAKALQDALVGKADAQWTVVNEGGKGTQGMIDLYNNPNWAKGYDVVVHNECFADTKDEAYIHKITQAHYAGAPAVVIHCAMHTYRTSPIAEEWREFLGVTSRRHDHQSKYPVKRLLANNPITKDMPETWTTPMDELYVIEKLWPNATALASSVSEEDGKTYPCVWTNKYGKARVFGTTWGHGDATFKDPVYLSIVSRGILWAAGRLD